MQTRSFRLAALVAGFSFIPALAVVARAADEPAKPSEAPARPAEGRGRMDPAALIDRVKDALKDLTLSEEQKNKVQEAVTKAKTALESAAKEAVGEGRERFQGIQKVTGELKDSLTSVLSEEQMKALTEKLPFLANRPAPAGGDAGARRPGLAAGGQAGAPGQRAQAMQKIMTAALEKLDISAEQKEKIKTLNAEFEKKTKALIEEAKGDRAAMAEKIRPLMEERRKQMQEILSSEQAQKLQELVREQTQKLRDAAGGEKKPEPKKDESK